MKIPCTQCRYCQPCPGGIKIPECFAAYNDAFIYEDVANAKDMYNADTENGGSASECQECGVCVSLCPQKIAIRAYLKDVVTLFRHC
jgi:predicted aldo/keto reductase-like oxidoreductase